MLSIAAASAAAHAAARRSLPQNAHRSRSQPARPLQTGRSQQFEASPAQYGVNASLNRRATRKGKDGTPDAGSTCECASKPHSLQIERGDTPQQERTPWMHSR